MRPIAVLLLAAVAGAAEVARRDAVLAIESGEGGFAYELDTPIGVLAGDDAFGRIAVLRLGGRWAMANAGQAVAPLFGLDAEVLDASLADGGMTGYGGGIAAGATWAARERIALDLEAFASWQRCTLDLAGEDFAGGSGLLRQGLRLRAGWSLLPRWSISAEGGWCRWSADLAAGDGRGLQLEGDGAVIGLALSWRPSARPGAVE